MRRAANQAQKVINNSKGAKGRNQNRVDRLPPPDLLLQQNTIAIGIAGQLAKHQPLPLQRRLHIPVKVRGGHRREGPLPQSIGNPIVESVRRVSQKGKDHPHVARSQPPDQDVGDVIGFEVPVFNLFEEGFEELEFFP